MSRLLLPLLLVLFFAGCATTPPLPQPDDAEQAWQAHRQQMTTVQQWQLNGRLLTITGHETWSTGINWRQQGEEYRIMLIAPLGQGSLLLEGDLEQVTLQPHDGEAQHASDPETLLARQLGWHVPLTALRYWVLGLPAPGAHQHQINEFGLLQTLQQDGWEIEFRDYTERNGLLLPGRIFANNHQAKVRLSIGDWRQLD